MEPQSAPETAGAKPLYRHPVFYLVVLAILFVSLVVVLIFPNQKTDLQSAEYETGLPKDQVVVQLESAPTGRYPLVTFDTSNINIYLDVFEGLTVFRNNTLQPGLATSWTNPDELTWQINLRKEVKFQSGDTFTAKDVKYTIEQAKASSGDTEWVSKPMASRVDSVKVIDDYTVELKTKEPDATLLSWIVYVGIVSETQVTKDGLAKAVGTGPYKLVSVGGDPSEAVLEAYSSYWGGTPQVKKLVYRHVSDEDQIKTELEQGKLDLAFSRITGNESLVSKGFQVSNFRGGIHFLLLDTESDQSKYVEAGKNPFKDPKVRKAVLLALSVADIISAGKLSAEPVSQFATQELVGFNTSLVRSDKNVGEAKKLLTEAGFPDGFTVTLDVSEGSTEGVRNELQKQLAEIGVTVKINPLGTKPPSEGGPPPFFAKLLSGDFALMLASYSPDTIDSLDFIDTLFHTPSGGHGGANPTGYSNSGLDKILDEATSTFNVQKRIELTREAHALIVQDLPSIPLYTTTLQVVGRGDIAFKATIGNLLLGADISGRQKIDTSK
ncbi:MAG TPA: ABC transporter substrate-binding protein [Candidatus Nanoarchaeia archaeon]